jgi:hypothetical protein
MDTYKEMQYSISSKKPFFLFNMNPAFPGLSLMRFKFQGGGGKRRL